MSTENGNLLDEDIEVSDEEKYTDKKIKQRILNARQLLTESKNKLETERLIEPEVEYSQFEGFAAWANLVKSYIYELGILLNHDDVPDAEYYRDKVPLGEMHMIPQDKDGIPFSQIMYDGVSDDDIIYQSPTLKRGCKLPRPKKIEFEGLLDVAEADILMEWTWIVNPNPRAAPPNQKRITVRDERPVPKSVFQQAVVESDQFLQNAGIGLDLSESGVPEFGFEEVHEDEPAD